MSTSKNPLKASLAAGVPQIGVWLGLGLGPVAEIAGTVGWDWCLIDAEHGPNDLAAIRDQLIALSGTPAEPVVRVPANDPVWLARVLDLGARNLMIPMVDTAEAAEAAVRACRYPPDGKRGAGGPLIRAARYGADKSYQRKANDSVCLIVQAESARALSEIDAIAAVDGVDAVFVGPADLAASLGRPDELGHPEVQGAIRHIVERALAAGKATGMITFDPTAVPAFLGMGVSMLAVGADVVLLREALAERLAAARKGAVVKSER